MKPTILTFRLVNSEVEKYRAENQIEKPERAFLEYVIEKELGINRDEVVESIVDGSHDRGIDAIHIEEDAEDRPVVYIFQSKFYRAEDKFDRSLEGDALKKMQHAIENIILKSPEKIHDGSEVLLSKLRDIKSLANSNPRFEVVFCSNSSMPSAEAEKQFQFFIDEKSQGQDFFRVKYIDLKTLNELITPTTSREINSKVRLSGKYFEWGLGDARVVVGRISGNEVAKLCKEEGKDLFDRNVRGYLSTKKNKVNEGIYKTATDPIEASKFFFLNNGITFVCRNITYLPVDESPEIEISNLQIVNGGQTSNAIFEAALAGRLSSSVYVLAKIVATENRGLIERITESTNTQTSVTARDLRSNDPIQKTIEKILLNSGHYYETRKNKYKDFALAKGKRVDMEIATQAYYATVHKKPADAKNKKKQLFGALYEDIFRAEERKIADDILVSFKMLEWVRKSHLNYKERFTFVKYAEYHSIAVLHACGISSLEKLGEEATPALYERILLATAEVVREENSKLGDSYSHRMLFIDPPTFGRIIEALTDLP